MTHLMLYFAVLTIFLFFSTLPAGMPVGQASVLSFTEAGSRGTPANASGLYRCVVFDMVNDSFIRLSEENITVNVQGVLLIISGDLYH